MSKVYPIVRDAAVRPQRVSAFLQAGVEPVLTQPLTLKLEQYARLLARRMRPLRPPGRLPSMAEPERARYLQHCELLGPCSCWQVTVMLPSLQVAV